MCLNSFSNRSTVKMSVLWKHFTVATCYVLLFAAFFPLLPPPLTPVGLSIVAFWRLAGLSLALSLFLYQLELEQFTLHISQNKKRKNVFFFSSSEWILSRRETQASVWQWVSVLHQHSLWHASPIIIPTICNRTWQTWSCFAYEKRWQTRWRDLVRRLWRRSDEAWFNYTE